MEEQLGESFKVCLFCSRLTDETETLNLALLKFLQDYLGLPFTNLPRRVCPDCHRRTINAKKFKEKCHLAFEKLKKNHIGGEMVWGRSESESREVEEMLGDNKASNGLDYDRKLHGPLIFPRINLTANDRALAEAHMERSKSGRIIKRKFESLDESWDRDTGKKVKVEPDQVTAPSDPGPEECDEVFPSVGPYQCEICQNITDTKQDFVNHIKAKHRSMIDPSVLRILESDLRKRIQKEKMKGKYPATRKKQKTKKKYSLSDSDEEFGKVERKQKSGRKIEYVDEEGNPLPKSAGKLPGICSICGRTISRGNEIVKHQQSLNCKIKAREMASEERALVVVVKNFTALKNSQALTSSKAPSPTFKSEMTKRYEAENVEDPGDYDEDYDEGQDEVDDAIKAAVAASLETAKEDLFKPQTDQVMNYQATSQQTFQSIDNFLWP